MCLGVIVRCCILYTHSCVGFIHIYVCVYTCTCGSTCKVFMWRLEVEARFSLMTLNCLFQDRFLFQPRAQWLAELASQRALRSTAASFISVVQVWSVCLAFTWVLALNSAPHGCMAGTWLNRSPAQPHKCVWKKNKSSSSVSFLRCGSAISLHREKLFQLFPGIFSEVWTRSYPARTWLVVV